MPVKVGESGVVKSVNSMPVAVNGVIKNPSYGYVGLNGTVTRFFPYGKRVSRVVIRPTVVSRYTLTDANGGGYYTSTSFSAASSLGGLTATSNYFQLAIYSGSNNISSGLSVYYSAYIVWDDNSETELHSFIQSGGTFSITVNFSHSVSSSSYTYYRYGHNFYGGNTNNSGGSFSYTQANLTGSNGWMLATHEYNYSTGTVYNTHSFSNCSVNGTSVSVVCENKLT